MRVLFTGGGTGGHVSPALAIAEIFKTYYKECDVAFVGRKNGPENAAIKDAGYMLYTVDISGFKRSLSIKNISALFKIPFSLRQAGKIISDFNPDIIIGTGGYVSYPALRCGIRRKIPTLIHESNAYPGLVTRLLSKKCTAVLLGVESAADCLKKEANAIYVGNPVRRDFYASPKDKARASLGLNKDEIYVISFGGSGGAEKLNNTIAELMQAGYGKKVVHLHATGKKYYDEMIEKYPNLKEGKMKLVPYINNMQMQLSAADIAITRSGAMTVAELCASRTPSILIPSPNVAANHQFKNAENMRKAGAALLLTEEELDSKKLKKAIEDLVLDKHKRQLMEKRLAVLSAHKTEKAILTAVNNVLKERTHNSASN